MRLVRPALALSLAGVAAAGSFAYAADAPATTATSKTLYLSSEGCGTTQEAGRLEPKAGVDGSTGCGTIGGVPLNEVPVFTPTTYEFTSTSKTKPFKFDAAKKVTGQVAAGAWTGVAGIGTVTWDISMVATTAAGKTVDFGTKTITANVSSPTTAKVTAPFELTAPAGAAGQTFKTVVFTYALHGANVGFSAQQYDGDFYVVLPSKAK